MRKWIWVLSVVLLIEVAAVAYGLFAVITDEPQIIETQTVTTEVQIIEVPVITEKIIRISEPATLQCLYTAMSDVGLFHTPFVDVGPPPDSWLSGYICSDTMLFRTVLPDRAVVVNVNAHAGALKSGNGE